MLAACCNQIYGFASASEMWQRATDGTERHGPNTSEKGMIHTRCPRAVMVCKDRIDTTTIHTRCGGAARGPPLGRRLRGTITSMAKGLVQLANENRDL